MTNDQIKSGGELLACPFCGGKAIYAGDHRASKVMCSNDDCEAETGPWYDNTYNRADAKAAANWNRRTTAKAGEDGVLSMRINELLQNDPVCRGRVTVETIDRIAALSSIEEPRG